VNDSVAIPTMADPVPSPDLHRAILPSGWWAPALTLAERRALPGAPPWSGGDQRAARRLARWRLAHDGDEFQRRLVADGLTEAHLLALIEERPADLAGRAGPAPVWARFVEAALSRASDGIEPPMSTADDGTWQAGFATVTRPFTRLAVERLAGTAEWIVAADAIDPAAVLDCFSRALDRALVWIAGRTLVLELNVLRVSGQLTGETPRERFWSFARHFAAPIRLGELFREYPVLARLLAQTCEQAVEAWAELLGRLTVDRAALVAVVFADRDPGRLVEVLTGGGDAHQRGRSVALLRFKDGSRLVYKPRPLSTHVHFNEAVTWLNRRVIGLGLRTLAVVGRERYGWVEFAIHEPCANRAGVRRYFRRQGALLALLYALEGSDFHFENLIASGDQPVLIDLEALLHPRIPPVAPDLLISDPAWAAFETSVSRVGLLPSLVVGEEGAMIDMGGSGGDAGRRVPFKSATFTAAGTDEMRLTRAYPEHPGSQNRPKVGDADVNPCEFVADLIAGFRAGYDAVAAHREDLTGPAGLLSRFARDEVRVVTRPTRLYAMLLHESTHPDVMRDALDRDRVLDHLWTASVGDPKRQRMIGDERADLWAGDIPYFSTRPGSRDVWTSTGRRHHDLLAGTALDRARSKILDLGSRDRHLQEWLIRALFATREGATSGGPEPRTGSGEGAGPVARSSTAPRPPDAERVMTAVRAIGDRLDDTAYRDRTRVGWLGLEFVDQSSWAVEPLRSHLYGGYAGVALFLSQLADLTGDDRYAALARGALAPVPQVIDALRRLEPAIAGPTGMGCGAFSSPAGLAYALCHVAANLRDADLLASVDPLLALVASGIADDEAYDIIDGTAGGLAALIAVHEATGSTLALDLARRCADRLAQVAQPQDRGVAWMTPMAAERPMTGFSHGAAGIGWALLRFAGVTGERRYAETGLAAFRYERSQYRARLGNWADNRLPAGEPGADSTVRLLHAWCHGAPGIGLARAGSGRLDDPDVAADLDAALRATLASTPEANHSLCHGQLGTLELLTVAAAHGRTGLEAERDTWAARTVESIERSGPICGTPGSVATPGLMTGLAGIGHGLLRLAFPDRVPCVLLLSPPRRRP
jgi:type 2 lantibiotic biosynthesis protein LanM